MADDLTTPLVHLYRGELGRMTMYRVRLDTTTNWAVGTTAAVISFVLGSSEAPHYVLGIALLLDFGFVSLEARRFQRFATSRQRVLLLERGFYCELLGETATKGWRDELRANLATSSPPVSWFRAMGARIRRNYLWVFAALGVAWLLALDLGHRDLGEAAAIGPIPGSVVLCAVLALGALLLIWALVSGAPDAESE